MQQHQIKQNGWRWAYRYLTGRPLDGYRRTDCGYLRPGRVILAPSGHASRWSHLPGWQRQTWRVGPFLAATILAIGYLIHPTITLMVVGALVVFAGYRTAVLFRNLFRNRQHKRTYLRPFVRAVVHTMGINHPAPAKGIQVPINFQDEDGEPVVVPLPEHRVPPELKVALRELVSQKLGLRDPIEIFHTVGDSPYVSYRPAPRPPATVGWDDIADAFRNAAENAPVLGLGARRAIVDADFDADSPHIAVSAGSGGGKSVLVRNILVHGLHHGAGVIVFDYKRSSQKPLEGLPGVVILKNIEDIHDWALAIGEEAERRNRAADDGEPPGHRILIAVEEWNALAGKLNKYWQRTRDKSDPKVSPAVEAISDVTFMGRHVLMNVIGVAQMLTARTTGGPETRENFATRCLTRYTVNAWKMLTPEVWPMPKKSTRPGRWQIVKAGEAAETQVAFLTDAQAQAWALSGTPAPVDVLLSYAGGVPVHQEFQPGTAAGGTEALDPLSELLTLRRAVDEGLVPFKLATARKRLQRAAAPPPVAGRRGQENVYTRGELVAWIESETVHGRNA